jgi:hypothetical protein
MYEGREFPKYLGTTPIKMETQHPYAVVEPNSGEQIAPADLKNVLSPRSYQAVNKFANIIRGARTYGQLIDRLAAITEKVGDVYSNLVHHVVASEDTGAFNVGIQLSVKPSAMDFEVLLVTVIPVVYDPTIYDNIYLTEELDEVDSYTVICASSTNAMLILTQSSDINLPQVKTALSAYNAVNRNIDEYRWSGVTCELLHGVPPLFVMRRWGIVNNEGVIPEGYNEYAKFNELFEKYAPKGK